MKEIRMDKSAKKIEIFMALLTIVSFVIVIFVLMALGFFIGIADSFYKQWATSTNLYGEIVSLFLFVVYAVICFISIALGWIVYRKGSLKTAVVVSFVPLIMTVLYILSAVIFFISHR